MAKKFTKLGDFLMWEKHSSLFFFSWSSSVHWWYSDQQSPLSDQDKADLSRAPHVYLSGVPVWETKHYPLHHQGM